MSNRERFWRTMRFQPVDRLPLWADWLGPWQRWRGEGLPIPQEATEETFDFKAWCLDYFGFEGMYSAFWGQPRVPVNIGPCPPFEASVLEETDAYRIQRQSNGVIVKQFKDSGGSLHSTQFLAYPIKNRADWTRFRDEHLQPDTPGRYPESTQWTALKREWAQQDAVISIDGGSFYGFVRDWVGPEALSFLFYDDPDLVHEIMDYLADFYIAVLHRALDEVQIDFAMFWEDMCTSRGPSFPQPHSAHSCSPATRK